MGIVRLPFKLKFGKNKWNKYRITVVMISLPYVMWWLFIMHIAVITKSGHLLLRRIQENNSTGFMVNNSCQVNPLLPVNKTL